MAIGFLGIIIGGMSLVSILGLLLLYMTKQTTAKKMLFYVMAAWGILIALICVTSLPVNWGTQRAATGILGCVSLGGIVIYNHAITEKHHVIAYVLVTVSVAGGMLKLITI